MEYEPFYTPGDLGESAFIESLFKANKIHYFIQNDAGGRLIHGMSLSQRIFYVHPDDLQLAREVLNEKIKPRNPLVENHLEPHTYIAIAVIVLFIIIAVIYFIVKEQPLR